MKIIDCVQGSKEWFAARCGLPTASSFDKIVTSTGKRSVQREKYLFQLAGERILQHPEESYSSEAMERGKVLESEAREYYEFTTGEKVEQVGLCITEGDARYGASPDGLVNDDGGLEIKCPKLSTHVGYLLANKLPADYVQQVQGQLLVTGRKWSDFVSYFPGMQTLVVRVYRDEQFLKLLSAELDLFCAELKEIYQKIRGQK